MALTPNYGFIIPTGSDAVNLLTQCYPNFSSLDTILKPIQESGVTVATDTKVGTVHQLVRTDSSCNMFRFIATGNYASGDTFTVDGASVTATAMDGTALSAGAFVINQSVVCILNNLVLTVLVSGKETTSLPASAVTYDNTGSGLTATNAQDAIDEVVSMIPATPTEHGLYELWANPNMNTNFAGQTITINNFDSDYDAIEFEKSTDLAEFMGSTIIRIERAKLSSTETAFFLHDDYISVNTGTLRGSSRYVYLTLTGTTLTVRFDDAEAYILSSYGSATTPTQDNSREIPLRILGLKHNN